ncbi:restriction endonuclease subunit S [Salmonella enterica]|uniref:Restriction endonuclease subunit S n=1 Tax=Salmonella enterica TaxID=28901 RepID=A0A5U7LND7_SALER|nr:restriction endonuclease subunit S [Salmonella enterica]EBR4140337.1 restriction endonuclease subunit S [Salmonella enterica]EFU3136164.1 restriction endonuclease subunit S [Salmonella enterica]MII08390.1 restriction endonuclease subunit S [Salmonella enterica]
MSLGYISGTLPSEWETPFLVDLVSPKQWKTISTKELTDDGYVVYGANGKIGFYNKYTHESATLMITCRGATCGNLHISEPLSYINGNAMALDNQPTKYLNIKYLKYSLQARGLQDTISGSAQPQITKQGLEKVQIPLPTVSEQKIIAEKLDTLLAQVDSTKARLEHIPQILKRFRQAVLAAVVDAKSVNENTLTTLGNIAKNIKYGTSKKCSETQGSTAVLRIPNIGPGYIINSNLKYADFDQKELATLTLKEGDLLLIRSNGSVDLVGKVAVISENDTSYLYAGYLIRVRLNKDRAIPKYISYCLQSPQLRQVIENIARSTSGVNNINSKELASLEIPLPPLPEQHEIVRRVEQLFAYADTIEKQVNSALTRVNSLTQSILAKAFRGELTAQWRAENPDLISGENSAAALLEKIKAERAASGGKKASRKKA